MYDIIVERGIMSEVLFVTRKENTNPAINYKLKERLDCEFVNAEFNTVISTVEKDNVKLVVLFLSKLSTQEEIEVQKFLQNAGDIHIILSGEQRELVKYINKYSASIVRVINTPILLSDFVKEIQKCLEQINDDNLEYLELIEEKDIVKVEPKHILVIDDEPVMLRTISNWLNDLFIVSVAKSGTAALQYLTKEIPDLILLDYEMPVCDGIQVLKMIRAEDQLKNIPVFFLTAVDDRELVQKALELKPQGYILKSKGADHLISRIESYF